jgi:hypothetical protein
VRFRRGSVATPLCCGLTNRVCWKQGSLTIWGSEFDSERSGLLPSAHSRSRNAIFLTQAYYSLLGEQEGSKSI